MEIEKSLQKVGLHIKTKVVKGSYKFISADSNTAKIQKDDKYEREEWIDNDPEYDFRNYVSKLTTILFGDHMKLSEKERMQGWRKLETHLKEYRNTVIKDQKIKKIKELQEEIKSL